MSEQKYVWARKLLARVGLALAENPLEFWKSPSGIHSRDAQPKKTIDTIISHHLPVQLGASLRVHDAKGITVCSNIVRARGVCEKCPKIGGGKLERLF